MKFFKCYRIWQEHLLNFVSAKTVQLAHDYHLATIDKNRYDGEWYSVKCTH